MLDGIYVVSRDLLNLNEQESKWIYDTFCIFELSNGKHSLENGERICWRKLSKPSDALRRDEIVQGLLPQTDQPDNQHHQGDHSDSGSSSLFHQLGRDISINCLVRCSRSDYSSIALLNQSFRSLLRSGELYRLRRQMGIKENWVYFACDLLEWVVFDPIRYRWTQLPRLNCQECFMYSDKESLAVGTELLVFGKEMHAHVVYKYSLLTHSWSSGTTTNTPRCLFASASLGEIGIVAGGCDSTGKSLSYAELYNSETGTWVTLPNMNKPRKMCSGVFMDGKFYAIGGIGIGHSDELTSGEMYDLETRTWTEIPNMFPALNGGYRETPATAEAPPLLAVVKNELYAAHHADSIVRKYDKMRNLWATVGRLPDRATSMNGWGIAFRGCEDQLLVIGGPMASHGGNVEVNSWVPGEGSPQWRLLARNHSGGFVYNCAVMGC